MRFRDVDLSSSTMRGGWLEKCVFENVRFDACDLSGLADHGNRFEGCSFARTKFRRAVLGYKGSEYENCAFEKADFSQAGFIRAEFTRCSFDSCKMLGVDFNASSFVECQFLGVLEDVWFRGGYPFPSDQDQFGVARVNTMENVSFEKAELHDVHFSNDVDLSSITPPLAGDYRRYSRWKASLEQLAQHALEWQPFEKSEVEVFVNSHMVHAKGQDWYLLNGDDVRKEHGPELGSRILESLSLEQPDA